MVDKTSVLVVENEQNLQSAIQKAIDKHGYSIIESNVGFQNDKECVDFYSELLFKHANPIKVFNNVKGLWRPISVKFEKHPNSSEGVGASHLHMDFVNVSKPPRFVALLCIRPDPFGGGSNVISNVTNCLNSFNEEELQILEEHAYTDGKCDNLSNIGVDINPFAILNRNQVFELRFTANLLKLDLPNANVKVLKKLYDILVKRQQSYLLKKHSLLYIDQTKTVHGKKALLGNQRNLGSRNRRLLLQSFYKEHD